MRIIGFILILILVSFLDITPAFFILILVSYQTFLAAQVTMMRVMMTPLRGGNRS